MLEMFLRSLAAAAALGLAAGSAPAAETVRLQAAGSVLEAEVARTRAQLERGLMGSPALPDGRAMLFVFPHPSGWCMWMKDTPAPLSIAFVSEDGRIISVEPMQPFSTRLHCPPEPAAYGIEAPAGSLEKRGLKPGVRVQGLPR